MNFLLTPVLIVGLAFSPASAASECIGTAEAGPAEACAACDSVKLEAAPVRDDVARQARQARKHATYYRLLVRAQRGDDAQARQYMVQSEFATPDSGSE